MTGSPCSSDIEDQISSYAPTVDSACGLCLHERAGVSAVSARLKMVSRSNSGFAPEDWNAGRSGSDCLHWMDGVGGGVHMIEAGQLERIYSCLKSGRRSLLLLSLGLVYFAYTTFINLSIESAERYGRIDSRRS